jgi:hypothetical protein
MAGATLSGAVFTDANGNGTRDANETALAGVSVDLLAADGSGAALATVRTDATGAYAFTALAGGAYAMRFTPAAAGYRGSAGTTNANGQTLVTNLSVPSDANTTVDEGFYKTGSIAGIIFNDTNGNGVFNAGEVLTNGVSVDLYNDIGVLLASTTSSNKDPFKPGTNGVYSFQNLAPGTYTVAVTAPDGKVTSGVTTLKEVVTSGAVIASQNFGVRNNPPTVSLSGTIFADGDGNGRQGPGEAGLAGTSVLLSDAATGFALKTTVTDAAGHYSFGTTAGSYRVTVATPEGLKGTTATTLATGSLASGAANAQLNVGFAPDPVLDKTGAIPAATVLNVVLRGQSNTYFPTLYGDLPKLEAAIEAQLGFDGVRQKVNVIGTRDNADGANTEWPGTGMLTDWLSPVNGDYRNGWTANAQEIGLLSTIGQWSAAQKAAPTAVVWLHNENDSQNAALTPAMWESAVRYEAGLVRGVLGQDAATVPYLFVNAIPFPAQTPAVQSTQPVQSQAIRVGQAELTEDKDFNAGYAARQASDVDMDVDGHGITRQPGSVHFSRADATQIFDRIALSVAETFRASALPGSPLALASGDIDDDGPRVVRAERVAGAPEQLLLTVAFDQATSLQALGSVAAAGTGWSLRADWNAAASQALATRAELVDASHLRLTFDRDVPAATELFYGWGGARIALPGQPGIGAAIYDDNDLPLWVDPRGLAVSQAVTQAGPIAVQSIADSGPGIDGGGNGLLKAGAAVTLAVQFTDAVAVTGTPVLTLNTGATAAYAGGSGTGTLRFTYTVAPGQTAQDLAVTGIDLTNATLAGTDGSPVTLAGFATAMPGTLTVDTTAPSLALTQIPAATIQATSAAGAAVTFAATATATDAVDGTDPVTFREGTTVVASGQTFGLGPHTLTATATDAAGNSADPVAFSFTVADTAKPVIAVTAPATTIQATFAAGAAVTFAATAADAVDGTDPVTFREGTTVVASGQTFGLGPHTLTATATDAAGNSADPVAFSFTVADTPIAAADTAALDAHTFATGNVLANDVDLGGAALHVTAVRTEDGATTAVPTSGTVTLASPHGALTIGADGRYAYLGRSPGADSFAYTIADSDGASATLTTAVAAHGPAAEATFAFAFTQATLTYQNGAAVLTGPDGTVQDVTGIGRLHFTDGTIDEADGSPLVDDLFYLAQNRDVWQARVDPDRHYAEWGWREGRDPNPQFSTSGYLAANPDVAAAGVDPLTHYDRFGWQEGRNPSAAFDTEAYLAANPDVAAAGIDPLAHYLEYGQVEGRTALPVPPAGPAPHHLDGAFDATYYLAQYPDVARAAAAAGGDPDSFAFAHYLRYGAAEGRDPDAYFSTTGYLAANPDVAEAGLNPLLHYEAYGWREGRNPSALFDTKAYLAANPDVAAAGIDPLAHYLQYGLAEHRDLA